MVNHNEDFTHLSDSRTSVKVKLVLIMIHVVGDHLHTLIKNENIECVLSVARDDRSYTVGKKVSQVGTSIGSQFSGLKLALGVEQFKYAEDAFVKMTKQLRDIPMKF